jgi:hypothetical protein
MKKLLLHLIDCASFVGVVSSLQAQPTAHYVPGVEGIKAASLPPPGWYVRGYNVAYFASTLNNGSGDRTGPPNFQAFTYANVSRVIWITDTKILGGNIGVDALVPLVYQNVRAGGYSSGTFGVGDLFAESTLSWHIKQFDFSAGLGIWMPTGESGVPPTTRAGLGYWTPMLTAGATWYANAEKTWALSALCRYEFNTEQRDTQVTPGEAFTLEWGASKTIYKVVDVGAVGYYQQKVTGDSGPVGLVAPRDRVGAVGPEVNVAFPKPMLFVSFRYVYEFLAENRAQGHTLTLTLTKRF